MLMSKRIALYLRVSTDGQSTDNQRIELEGVARQRGWDIVAQYDDNGVSGAKGREHRKQFDAMIKAATRGEFDLIAAWSVDRLGRSLQDLVSFLNELQSVGCDLYLHQQALDTSTPAGRAMFGMCGVFAEFERSMIQERVKAGLQRARSRGKILGRPKLSAAKRRRLIAAYAEVGTVRGAARKADIPVATASRILKEERSA
jgi:DNA invertase Pin-like site-specific DNA recombinase